MCDPVLDFYSATDNYLRKRDEISLDVRFLGDFLWGASSDTQYVLGVYVQQRDEDLHRQTSSDFFSFYATDRRAIYGQLDTIINDRLGLTVGLRYEDFGDSYRDTIGLQSTSDDDLQSGELTLTYSVADNSLLYATLSRGSKAGGVNTEVSANFPSMQPIFQSFIQPRLDVGSETLLNKEIGLKGSYLDNQLVLRTALFHMRRDLSLIHI